MFGRAISSLERKSALRIAIPRFIPKSSARNVPSRIIQRLNSNQPCRRGFPRAPQQPKRESKVKHTRWDPSQIQHARPLFNNDRFTHALRHKNTKYLAILIVGGSIVFYCTHIEEVPVSGRKRFMCFSEESAETEGLVLYQNIMRAAHRQGALVSQWDDRTRMVRRVMDRLITGGNLKHVDFEIHVLESPEMNAFVLPGGKVFVYSGMLNVTRTDDALAAILGHEIAHNLARHSAEQMSRGILIFPLRWALIFLDATGYTGGLGRILGDVGLSFGFMMPASRVQESEADYIGLMLMAKSCYNPEAAVRVWQKIDQSHKDSKQNLPEWTSTHPSDANRIKKLIEWLPKAEEQKVEAGCTFAAQYQQDFQQVLKSMWH
ncbi:mitochondrial metalloendopeptidase OMA1 [Calycina marina]|uniref:Mitochondrial metalloendopeptidase OMA1 n=1 Tax=Calycina marina TaxID=1763456 RepID=A0A9P7Z3K4_9HELO|nr:mitochondrial metalloendopeptidase OMA1 [Calycina marina]